jgi:aminoglycoside/choline kinase family phosphotransferase
LFGRENTFYSNYSKERPGRPPRHYYSIADRENDDFILVMEDLGHARFVTQLESTSAEDALAVVRTLGKINAYHCETDVLSSMSWLPPFPVLAEQFTDSYAEGTPLLLKNFGDFIPPEFEATMDAGTKAHLPIANYLMTKPNSLVHGDARIENIAFETGSGPNSVRIFDWAGALRGPAIYDLTYFIAGSLDTDLRRSMESDILEAYYDEMVEGGVKDFSMADLKENIRICSVLFFGFFSYVGKLVPPDEAGRAVMQSIIPPMIELMRDYDAIETLKRF